MLDPELAKAELNRLYQLLYERDKAFEKAKLTRALITIAGFAVAFFLVMWKTTDKNDPLEILAMAVLAILLSGFYFFVNVIVFGYLSNKGRDEQDALERIRKQIEELRRSIPQ